MGYTEISQLSLGNSVAESEASDLSKYFLTTPTYIFAKNINRRKTYYIGQRGAGKSALFNKLAVDFTDTGDSIILKITPNDFSYEKFNRQKHTYSDIRAVYGTVWHYTLIAHMFKCVIAYYDKRPHLKKNRGNIEVLRRYLVEKDVEKAEGFLGIFLSFFGEFTNNPHFNKAMQGSSLTSGGKFYQRLISLSEISEQISAFNSATDTHPVYLFIDELDTGWKNTKEAKNFMHGLFYAVREVRNLPNVTVFVSLRSDMYNNLSSILPDPEKMRDEVERFSWTPSMLQGLIANRIIANYPPSGLPPLTPNKEALSLVFDDGVFDFILEHSLQRPREVIQFCNDALLEFSKLIYYGEQPSKVNIDVIQAVEPQFSINRFNDLCIEYKYQYPGLKILLTNFENSAAEYSMEEFKEKLEEAMIKSVDILKSIQEEDRGKESVDNVDRFLWLNSFLNSPYKLIQILFDIGFIKLYSQKDKKHLAYYEGSFLGIENVPRVKIHDVFISALKCQS